MKILLRLCLSLLLIAPLIGTAHAYTLTAADKADIARIERYMNDITTMRAKFVQS
jgi:hypothetical protein